MRHDYNFPSWFWNDDVTDEDRHIWFCQERAFRQSISQDTPWAREVRKQIKRNKRKAEARSESVSLEEYR